MWEVQQDSSSHYLVAIAKMLEERTRPILAGHSPQVHSECFIGLKMHSEPLAESGVWYSS